MLAPNFEGDLLSFCSWSNVILENLKFMALLKLVTYLIYCHREGSEEGSEEGT
jgi:hypothetical protein